MSAVISVLLGWLIGEIVYFVGFFTITWTIDYIKHRRFFKMIESMPPRSWMPDEEDNNDE